MGKPYPSNLRVASVDVAHHGAVARITLEWPVAVRRSRSKAVPRVGAVPDSLLHKTRRVISSVTIYGVSG